MMTLLQTFLGQHGIQHFAARELLSKTMRGGRRHEFPPVERWDRILGALKIADAIREELGVPVRVLSAYRTPFYNKLVGGSTTSEHVEFRALDLACVDHDGLVRVATRLMDEADAAGLATGLGLYPTFVHIDTGATKAHRRRWDER